MQALDAHISKDGFRLRGTMPSRVDGISDVVFGFALTLLVVSLEVPKTFAELHELLKGFLPFALSFGMLMLLWFSHYKFFRRYGLHDLPTITLNGLLLFFVLYFVYPLKFIWSTMFNGGAGLDNYGQVREMTLLYAGGFVAIYALFTLMYFHALRRGGELAFSPLERQLTRLYTLQEAGNTVVGLIVIALAMALPARKSALANFAFFLIFAHKTILGRKHARLSRHHADPHSKSVDM